MAMPLHPTPQPAPAKPAPAPRPAGAQPPPKQSRLGFVRRGLLREAKRFMFYGPPGVGKSSLAKDARAIFGDADRGSGHLDVPRYTFRDGPDGHIPQTLDDIYNCIDDLTVSPHDFGAFALDGLDAVEELICAKVIKHAAVKKNGDVIQNMEDFGFGKGFNIAADEWRVLLNRLDGLRLKRNMHIILIGHSFVKTFKNPTGEDYDRYRPKLDDKALAAIRQWCEVIGFVTFEDVAKKQNAQANRAKATTTGRRVIHVEHHAAWDAKSRLPLPPTVDLFLESPWSPFEAAIDALYMADPAKLREMIEAELERLGDTFIRADGTESTAEGARKAVAAAGADTSTLIKYFTALKEAQKKEVQP